VILNQATSNFSAYRHRFLSETKWSHQLSSQTILEAGCGPGSITPFALETGATVVSFDLSNGVEQASKAIGRNERSLIVQASLFDMPFRSDTFDKAFCFGVIQHTPDPAGSMRALASILKAGGALAADSYITPDPKLGGGHTILRAKYRFRKLLPDLPPRVLRRLVRAYAAVLFPLYKALRDRPNGPDFLRRMMIDEYRQRMHGMDEKFYREFCSSRYLRLSFSEVRHTADRRLIPEAVFRRRPARYRRSSRLERDQRAGCQKSLASE
jgi:SAM-dependent methyltransferase